MIRYALRCADGHDFESWFRDSAAFDTLDRAGQVLCSVCGSTDVKKTLMAPAVSGTGKNDTAPVLSKPASPAEAAKGVMSKLAVASRVVKWLVAWYLLLFMIHVRLGLVDRSE